MRKPLTRLSRVASRQAESALQPPGVAIRGVAALPLLALALLLLGHATMAWFHGTTQAGGSLLSSGTFASLMTLNTDQLQFTGLRGSDFQGSFTVTSKAGVSVPLAASWEGGGGPGSLSLSSPVIHPGETVTVTLAGTFGADYGGQAVVTIGQEGYDYGRLAVSVNVSTIPVQDLIQVTVVGDGVFKSGMAAPAFEWVKVMKVTQQPGALPADITVTVTQTPEDTHPVAVRPSTFRSTTAGTDIELYQEWAIHTLPTYVTLTLESSSIFATGSVTQTVILTHAGDAKKVTTATAEAEEPEADAPAEAEAPEVVK